MPEDAIFRPVLTGPKRVKGQPCRLAFTGIELEPFAIGAANKQEAHVVFFYRPFIERITERRQPLLHRIRSLTSSAR